MVTTCVIGQTTVWRVMMRETSEGEINFTLRGKGDTADIETMRAPDIHRILNHSGSFKELGLHMVIPLTIEDHNEAMTILLLIQNGMT